MAYRYIEDVALADVAFEATGRSKEEMFISAANALTEVMVHLNDIASMDAREIEIKGDTVDLLLYEWLSELVYLKDTELMLFNKYDLEITKDNGPYTLKARLFGEKIDRERHTLKTDVKAVTMHMFQVKQDENGWKAMVVVDI